MQSRWWAVGSMAAALAVVPVAAARQASSHMMSMEPSNAHEERIQDATGVLTLLADAPDNAIPDYLLERAEAIVVIPNLIKGGFVVGAEHGRGIVSRRQADGSWSVPAFVQLTGGSIGWQIGVQSVDLVLLVMNEGGFDQLLEDRFTIGGSVAVTAGPVGRNTSAATNAQVNSGILAYSRAQGLFAGATLDGAALHADDDANEAVYGRTDLPAVLAADFRVAQAVPAVVTHWQNTVRELARAEAGEDPQASR